MAVSGYAVRSSAVSYTHLNKELGYIALHRKHRLRIQMDDNSKFPLLVTMKIRSRMVRMILLCQPKDAPCSSSEHSHPRQ
jgi:hypothetical protein